MGKMDFGDLPVAPGQIIAGRYVVSSVIGRGGMGIVLAGKHLELGERVAIKFLHREHASHADRFFREARAAARIRSEHVVRIFDVGRLPTDEPYIVMEYLEGEDLADRLHRNGPMAPEQVADILLEVVQALAEAHAVGIVHRDLKPANIFLAKTPGRDDLVKLLDFGVAKVPEGGAITKTASLLGSPVYMSPEQLMAAKDVDARSDIWSLGVILWELLTNQLPFEGDSLVHLAIVVREKPTPHIREVRPDIPEELDALIHRCLAKDKNDRFPDVGEFASALEQFASTGSRHSVPRIRRVISEARKHTELASTLPPPSDEPISSLSIPKSPSTPRESAPHLEIVSETSVLAGSIAAVSAATNNPLVESKKKRRLMLIRGGVLAGVTLAAIVIGRQVFFPHDAATGADAAQGASTSAGLAAGATMSAPVASTAPLASTPPVMTETTASAPPVASSAPPPAPLTAGHGHVTPRKPPTATPPPASAPGPAVAPAPAAPAVNCNPPYTIDEEGKRRPKKECL